MNILLAATTILCLVAVWFVVVALRHVRRGRFGSATTNLSGGLLAAALGAFGVVVSTSYVSYSRLTSEAEVAEISFLALGDSRYEARLMIDGERDRIVTLRGDEWQLDARIVTWKPPMTVLGLEPIYRLERLSGRYANLAEERDAERTVHAVSEAPGVDVWTLAREAPLLTPGIDAYYGTATYLPMVDGARYSIAVSRDALVARPANDAARRAVGNWDE